MSNDITNNDNKKLEEQYEEGQILLKEDVQTALDLQLDGGKKEKYLRLTLAALSSLPWVGSVFSIGSAFAGLKSEMDQDRINDLVRLWLKEHEEKIKLLGLTLKDIYSRLDNFGEEIKERINSPEYLSLVRSTFRSWDRSDTEEKRQLFKKLIINAGAIKLCDDDLVRLFIKWIDEYHEAHFAVIKEISRNPGITRGEIWENIHPENIEKPRDDSSEAGLFAYLIRELSMGGVIHQEKEINYTGQYIRSKPTRSRGTRSQTMESPFEDSKPYVLTNLGKEFVSYVLNDAVTRIEN